MLKIAFVGRPNSGKSTLLNSLTGKDLKVGNWHGVTVSPEEIIFSVGKEKFVAVDLPGIYSLSSGKAEEKVTVDYLKARNYDKIVLVAEADKLSASLALFDELISLNKPITLFINFYGQFVKRKGKIDFDKLSEYVGGKTYFGEACKKKDVLQLREFFGSRREGFVGKHSNDNKEEIIFSPTKKKRENIFLKAGICYLGFLLSSFSVFWLAFGKYGVGDLVSSLMERFFDFLCFKLQGFAEANFNPFLSGFIISGVKSALSVFGFLPQVAVMSLGLDILDQSGYISALAVVTDGALTKLGLNGKAIYAVLGGFGCTTVAFALASGIDDVAVRRRTAICLPFATCSAKTPVYAIICKMAFKSLAPIIMVGIYFFSFILTLAVALLSFKTDGIAPSPLVIEIADLRAPKAKVLLKNLKKTVKNFALRIATTVFISSSFLYLFGSVTLNLTLTSPSAEDSILAVVGKILLFLFRPMGITDWRYSVSALVGIFAKEGILSSLTSLFPNGFYMSASNAIPYLLFLYAYPPCVSAITASCKLVGKRRTAYLTAFELVFAFLLSYIVRFFMLIVAKIFGVML